MKAWLAARLRAWVQWLDPKPMLEFKDGEAIIYATTGTITIRPGGEIAVNEDATMRIHNCAFHTGRYLSQKERGTMIRATRADDWSEDIS